jgi:hypothetical protein
MVNTMDNSKIQNPKLAQSDEKSDNILVKSSQVKSSQVKSSANSANLSSSQNQKPPVEASAGGLNLPKTLKFSPKSPKVEKRKAENQPERLIKSKKRVKEFGEVFTPEFIVKQMCDLCEPEISRIDGKIFEPTCGNGNFLVEILRRKLAKIKYKNQKQFEAEILLALSNVYAVDIQEDNVREARKRMQYVIYDFTANRRSSEQFLRNVEFILERTILVGNTLDDNDKKKKLKFYDFKLDRKTWEFEYTRYSLKRIEENFANSGVANFKNLIESISKFESPPPKSLKKKAHKKPQKPPAESETIHNQQQASLF